jgi:acetyl-CoA carboxylase carboxyltransferase component
VAFVDVGGFTIGSQAEKAGTIRDGTRAIATIYQTSVPTGGRDPAPRVGVAGAACSTTRDSDTERTAVATGILPAEGGIEAAFKAQLAAAPDPAAARARSANGSSSCVHHSDRPSASSSRK